MNARVNMCLFSVSMSWLGLPGGSVVKSPCDNLGHTGLVPGSERLNGNPFNLVWEIPWTEEPGKLQSTGSQQSQTGLSD